MGKSIEMSKSYLPGCKVSIGSKTVAEPLEECIKDLIFELEHLEGRIRFFTEEIKDALLSTPGTFLLQFLE